MTRRARLISLAVISVLTTGLYVVFGPVVEETYFRNDLVGPGEGELYISETPTDFSSVQIRWNLLLALMASFAAVAWLAFTILRKQTTSSSGNEVSK